MLNQVVLVGRLVREPELQKSEKNKQYMLVTLDFVDCILWDGVAKSTSSYCHKGDIVGVKGRIQSRVVETEDKSKKYFTDIIAERVTFLSSKANDNTN